MVDQASAALLRQLPSLTEEIQSYSTVHVVRHLHMEPYCGVVVFVNNTWHFKLDTIFGQIQSIHEVGSSLKEGKS